MTTPYSIDLRKVAMRLREEGKTLANIAQLLGVSSSTLKRWSSRSSLEPSKRPGRPPLGPEIDLNQVMQDNPGKTLIEIAKDLPYGKSTLCDRLKQQGYTYKNKSYVYVEADKKKQEEFLTSLEEIPPHNLFYLDESGVEHKDVKNKGWALKGQRLPGKKKGKNSKAQRRSVIALRNHEHKLIAPYIYEGTLNKELFREYLSLIIPTLPRGSTIVLDNLPAHKGLELDDIFLHYECSLKFLPPYSPDLNPIEKLWASVKKYINKFYTS